MIATHTTDQRFTIATGPSSTLTGFLHENPYSAARDFINGKISIEGDVVEAIRFYQSQPHSACTHRLTDAAARLLHARPVSWLLSLRAAAPEIRYHYDQSNDFYAQFLDRNMVYSCGYYHTPQDSLEQAQQAKIELICRKLRLQRGECLLDIGCGWGGLLMHAARYHGVTGVGCTLSHEQAGLARERIAAAGLPVAVVERDYRKVEGRFHKIASVGMFEHVGQGGLGRYFRRVRALLEPGGLFLNHGIARPEGIRPGAETLFLDRYVFPGSGLVPLSAVIGEAGRAGLEVVDVENLRPHYALTCHEWVRRLQRNQQRCRELVGDRTYRIWLLYLAASAISFEDGVSEVHQVLMTPRGEGGRNWLARHQIVPRGAAKS